MTVSPWAKFLLREFPSLLKNMDRHKIWTGISRNCQAFVSSLRLEMYSCSPVQNLSYRNTFIGSKDWYHTGRWVCPIHPIHTESVARNHALRTLGGHKERIREVSSRCIYFIELGQDQFKTELYPI